MTGIIYSRHYRASEAGLVLAAIALYAACVWRVAGWLPFLRAGAVRYAFAFICVQLAIQAVLVVFLVAGKHVRTVRAGRRAARIRRLESVLARDDSGPEALHLAERWPREFLAVTDGALQALTGSARHRIAALLESSSAYASLLADAAARDPGRVIQAISLLGKLENPSARTAVRTGLRHPSEAVRRAARKAIITSGPEEDRRDVLNSMYKLPFWERIILSHLAPADAALSQFLAGALASSNDEHVLVALEFVLTRQRLMRFPVPARLAESGNVEIRIKFFRALPFLSVDGGASAALALGLYDPDWRVRALAARACGCVGAREFIDRLIELCSSFTDPAEAGHAARALAAMGEDGWRSLQEVVSSGAADCRRIAVEVVERHMVGGLAVTR